MKTGVILQIRLGSSRLPGKAVKKIGNKTLSELAMEALKQIQADVHILATDRRSESELTPLAKKCGFEIYGGSESDVLGRFLDAAEKWNVDTIIRATGDNPLVSAELAQIALDLFYREKADFAALDNMPLGTGVEIIRKKSLAEAGREATDNYEREHVSPFLYRRPERYKIVRESAPDEYCYSSKVTVDTADDLDRIEKIFIDLYNGKPIDTSELVHYLKQGRSAEKDTVCSFH